MKIKRQKAKQNKTKNYGRESAQFSSDWICQKNFGNMSLPNLEH